MSLGCFCIKFHITRYLICFIVALFQEYEDDELPFEWSETQRGKDFEGITAMYTEKKKRAKMAFLGEPFGCP